MMDRRAFLAMSMASCALPLVAAGMKNDDLLGRWIVINSLGGLEDPNEPPITNPGDVRASVNARVIADARASGVTAINMTLGYVMGEGEPFEQSVKAVGQWDEVIAAHTDELTKIRSVHDIHEAKRSRKIGLIYGFQNAAMMGVKAERVDIFADLGVRVFQLTYNGTNAVGGGALSPPGTGLTPFGHEVVDQLNARRVIVDLSHSGEQICLDAARYSKSPVAITHTGCRAITDLPRNKSDEELRLVASGGGYVGIYFMPFLTSARNATSDDVVAHVEHAWQVCGEDHVGIGTDGSFTPVDDLDAYRVGFEKEIEQRRALGISAPGERPDVFPFVSDMRGRDQFRQLVRKLSARGHTEQRLQKLMGLSFLRYAESVWGA